MILQVLSFSRQLVAALESHREELAGKLAGSFYDETQEFLRVHVLYWLHHADRRNARYRGETKLLHKLREIAVDWRGETPPDPRFEFKLNSKERRRLEVPRVSRGVSPSQLQLVLLDALLAVFSDPRGEAVATRFFPRYSLLKEADLKIIKNRREFLELAGPLASFSALLSEFHSFPCFGFDVSLTETAGSWIVPADLRLLRLLQRRAFHRWTSVSSYELIGALELAGMAAEEARENEMVWRELERETGEMVNEWIDKLSRKLYLFVIVFR